MPQTTLRVLVIHPSYPNIFTRAVDALAERSGLSCACMVENRCRPAVLEEPRTMTFFGYDPTPAPQLNLDGVPIEAFVSGVRRGLGVANALHVLRERYTFDVILGSASNGCTLFVRSVVPSAVVAYCEHPGYFMQSARPEFPRTLSQYAHDIAYRSMVLQSVAQAELGMVASEHARRLFPPEVQAKVRAQTEGFPIPTRPRDRAALRAKLGLPDGPIVGFFGRSLEAVRGFDVFLQVLKRLRDVRPDVNVLVIGSATTIYGNEGAYLADGSFKRHALAEVGMAEHEIVWRDFLPYPEFVSHLFCIDLAVLPTLEGASNWSFFDAMAAGVPIISSTRSYVPELIDDGCEGYLLDPEEIEPWVRAALRLLDDPRERERIGRNARRRIKQRHTPERAADGYERILREAVALRGGGGLGTAG
jgi:glycosyltransferase involved in cell wall biosynthesis